MKFKIIGKLGEKKDSISKGLKRDRVFVKRDDLIRAFDRKYAFFQEQVTEDSGLPCVLSYYGIGGVGKTSTLRELQKRIDEDNSALHVDVDFQHGGANVGAFERNAKKQLADRYGFKFPMYELAQFVLAKRIGERASKGDKKEVESPSLADDILELGCEIPAIKLAEFLFNAAKSGIALAKRLMENRKEYVERIESSSIMELDAMLPELFRIELEENLDKSEKPLVVFMDTFEKVESVEWLKGGVDKNGIDWDECALMSTPKVFWIIAGRNELEWAKEDAGFEEILEQVSISEFSKDVSISFLKTNGVVDALCETLYDVSGGVPIYLNLCLDQYNHLIELGETPSAKDFGSSKKDLVNYYLRGFSDDLKAITYLLALLGRWRDDMFEVISRGLVRGKHITNAAKDLYQDMLSQSFVVRDVSHDGYYMHALVSEVILESRDLKHKDKVLDEYATSFVLHEKNSGIEKTDLPRYAFYVGWEVDYYIRKSIREKDNKDLEIHMHLFHLYGRTLGRENYDAIFKSLYEYARKFPESDLLARVLENKASNLDDFGDVEEAYRCYCEVNSFSDKLDDFDRSWVKEKFAYFCMKENRYAEAAELFAELIDCERIHQEKQAKKIKESDNDLDDQDEEDDYEWYLMSEAEENMFGDGTPKEYKGFWEGADEEDEEDEYEGELDLDDDEEDDAELDLGDDEDEDECSKPSVDENLDGSNDHWAKLYKEFEMDYSLRGKDTITEDEYEYTRCLIVANFRLNNFEKVLEYALPLFKNAPQSSIYEFDLYDMVADAYEKNGQYVECAEYLMREYFYYKKHYGNVDIADEQDEKISLKLAESLVRIGEVDGVDELIRDLGVDKYWDFPGMDYDEIFKGLERRLNIYTSAGLLQEWMKYLNDRTPDSEDALESESEDFQHFYIKLLDAQIETLEQLGKMEEAKSLKEKRNKEYDEMLLYLD